jgi:hypothetical protein
MQGLFQKNPDENIFKNRLTTHHPYAILPSFLLTRK